MISGTVTVDGTCQGEAARSPLVAGAPLGFVVGRLAWTAVARGLGVQQVVSAPFLAFALVGLAALAVANAASLMPARVSASVRPAEVLRTE